MSIMDIMGVIYVIMVIFMSVTKDKINYILFFIINSSIIIIKIRDICNSLYFFL